MTNKLKASFLAERARAMATVVLTRRDDLVIANALESTGLDYQVLIDREDTPMRLAFGVLLRGVSSPTTAAHADKVLKPTLGYFQGLRKFTYPVCLFFFTMQEDQEFFCWLAEPVMTPTGPKLVHHEKAACVEFTREMLDELVNRVVEWYDAVEALLIA